MAGPFITGGPKSGILTKDCTVPGYDHSKQRASKSLAVQCLLVKALDSMAASSNTHYDVVILGAGIAGLTLARHLLMYSDKSVLLLEKRSQIPPSRQKVGESNVQVQGYYLGKILDLEEHLLREHFLKYNLRFYWPTPGRTNKGYEDSSQSYIRFFSNICCYQLDRNKIEGELLRLNLENPRFSFQPGIADLDVSLATTSSHPHTIAFTREGRKVELKATWLVDTTGRAK